ncbi:GGDEF domain-containing protein [Psychromonas sp. MME2]|uniref:tetratricopeptide repeat protein n=1 Tax=unclassified Psychromonas TaxID=2614957 RepID=UPI00339C1E5F
MRTMFALFLLQISLTVGAFELVETSVSMPLREASNDRYNDPLNCVEKTKRYISQQKYFELNSWPQHNDNVPKKIANLGAVQLLAFCYTQLENYEDAINLLHPILQNNGFTRDNINILNLIALTIPPQNRSQLTNSTLLKMLHDSLNNLETGAFSDSPNLTIEILFAIVNLSLQENLYQDTLNALEEIKKRIKDNNDSKLKAWLIYYYGLYYNQINQPQLANSAFMQANKLAEQNTLVELNGLVKKSLVEIYAKQYRISTALVFAKQRIEFYLKTKNNVKQADSLIEYAILERQKNGTNESLIYLFNALELVQINKHNSLLPHIYLEIGRTYLANGQKDNDAKQFQLAQKYLQNARYHFKRLKLTHFQIECLLLLAQLNIMNKDPALAIIQLEKALQLSDNKYLPLRAQAFEMLALSYELTGNLQLAILHFKNFHALQNRIKQGLLELQQLQISEQLQLFEKTQNQEQLEAQNTHLRQLSSEQKTLANCALLLLILVSVLYFYTVTRNKNLNRSNRHKQQQLAIHKRTKLPLQYARNNNFNTLYDGEPLYYMLVNFPFLNNLNELKGSNEASKIEHRFGAAIKKQFLNNMAFFQLRDNQILFVGKQKEYGSAQALFDQIETFFTVFSEDNQIDNSIACGLVTFPFLKNSSRALSANRTLKLSILAMSAANQIGHTLHKNSWVELYAIDNLQPAFLDGDLWNATQIAINKGLIKINSSHPDYTFTWPALKD